MVTPGAPPLPARWTASTGPAFVGRRRELAALQRAWSSVGRSVRQVVFVGGDPGAGKSRLVAEASVALHRRGAGVLLGTCSAEFGSPYEPFTGPLSALLPFVAGDDAMLRTLLGHDRSGGAVADGRAYRSDLYRAAVAAVTAAAEVFPLVVVLEDLHLAGPAALELLGHLVEHTADTALLLLVTHRTTQADRSDPLVRTISALYRHEGVSRLDLAGLDTEDITDFLLLESGLTLAGARPGATLLRDQTGGNPFFLGELWRDLRTGGGLPALQSGAFAAPPSVRDMLHTRLGTLTAEARRVLELAALVGDEADVATVSAAAGCTPGDTLTAVDGATALGLVEPVPGDEGSFRFVHALARQAVLDLVPSARTADLHARIAQTLERRVPQTEDLVPRLAHHYSHARALGYADQAVRYLGAAARLASRSLAHDEAAGLSEQAAGLCADPEQRDELLLAAAQSHLLAAAFDRAAARYEQVATSGVPALRLVAAVGFEIASFRTGGPGSRAVELLSLEMKRVPHDVGHPTYVRALAGLGRALTYAGVPEQGAPMCDAALAHARACRDDELLADALEASMGWGLLVPAAAPDKLRRADELSRLAQRTGDLHHLAPAAYARAVLCYVQGDLAGLDAAQVDLVRAAQGTGQPVWTYSAATIAFGRTYLSGDFVGARAAAGELLALGRSLGQVEADGPYGVQMFMLARETGDLERVRGLVTGDEPVGEHWPAGLLGVYTALELAGPAARLLHAMLTDRLTEQALHARYPGVLALLAEAALWLHDREAAQVLRPLLADYEGCNLSLGAFDGLFGSADRYLGALDALLGQGEPERLFDSALSMDTVMRAPVHQAHTLTRYALHLRREGAAQRAQTLTAQALDIARPLGLTRVLRLLEPAAPAQARLTRLDALTARELDVLALLGEGLSNRAIAGRLVIAETTAANHVRSILAKTGSQNRTQAAMYGRRGR